MIVYRKKNGQASDIRFEPNDYVLMPDEIVFSGDVIPPVSLLHDEQFIDKQAMDAFRQSIIEALAASEVSNNRITTALLIKKAELTSPDVVAWFAWRDNLRSMLSSHVISDLPPKPPFPANT